MHCTSQMAFFAIQRVLTHRQRLFCGGPPFAREFAESPGKIYAGVDLCIAQSRQAFIDTGQGVGILNGYFIQRSEVTAKRNSPLFFFTITIPLAHGDSEGCITPKANKLRTSWLARSAFSGTFCEHLHGAVQPQALPLWCV